MTSNSSMSTSEGELGYGYRFFLCSLGLGVGRRSSSEVWVRARGTSTEDAGDEGGECRLDKAGEGGEGRLGSSSCFFVGEVGGVWAGLSLVGVWFVLVWFVMGGGVEGVWEVFVDCVKACAWDS